MANKPEPSDQMLRFFEAEISNKYDYNQADPATLDDAHNSLIQMPEDVLANICTSDGLEGDPEEFDRKDFEHEFKNVLEAYGPDYWLKEFST